MKLLDLLALNLQSCTATRIAYHNKWHKIFSEVKLMDGKSYRTVSIVLVGSQYGMRADLEILTSVSFKTER